MRINPKAAGIDVDAKEHVVAVLCDRDPRPVRTFQAFTLELHELARWLKRCGIETVDAAANLSRAGGVDDGAVARRVSVIVRINA